MTKQGLIFEILYSEYPDLQDCEAKLDAIESVNKLPNIGDAVKITNKTDGTTDKNWIGEVGNVNDFNCNRATGNTEANPLIEVTNPQGRTEHFWKEELEKINRLGT